MFVIKWVTLSPLPLSDSSIAHEDKGAGILRFNYGKSKVKELKDNQKGKNRRMKKERTGSMALVQGKHSAGAANEQPV